MLTTPHIIEIENGEKNGFCTRWEYLSDGSARYYLDGDLFGIVAFVQRKGHQKEELARNLSKYV